MGDMADYCFDVALQQQIEYDEEIAWWLSKSDDELKKATAKARKPIIISIRKFAALSKKQRHVLAKWAVDHDEPDYYA